jgi:hypothetical protein
MTIYWREGFWRTSAHGNVHWVEGHQVDRNEWGFTVPAQRNEVELRRARAHEGGTARVVQPNADCPVCGRPVFFYQNAFGSRVFFDELGPPWPKHPCTAQSIAKSGSETVITLTSERLRTQEEFNLIRKWSGEDQDAGFERRYGTLRWDVAVFVASYVSHDVNIIVINTENGYRYFTLGQPGSLSIIEGQLVTYFGNWLSYISPADLNVTEVKLRRVGAKRALHHILDIERLDATDEEVD